MFVKEWVKSNQLTVFKYNNAIYQAIFVDKSEFLMSSSDKAILFISKDRKRYAFNMRSNNLYKNRSIVVRLEYFKAVLRGWITSTDDGKAG